MVATRERPLSLSVTFSAAWSKVKCQGRPVVRREIGDGQQWVGRRVYESAFGTGKIGQNRTVGCSNRMRPNATNCSITARPRRHELAIRASKYSDS
jgi:hypothetical protein